MEIYFYVFPNIDFSSKLTKIEIAKNMGKPFNSKSYIEMYFDLKRSNKNISPNFFPRLLINDSRIKTDILPLSGRSNTNIIFINENGKFPIIKTDKYGFNNLSNQNIEILIIGDSFAEGCCVEQTKSISFNMNQEVATFSLGKGGNGPLLEYASLKEYGAHFKPKVIFWLYYVNDIPELKNELKSEILKKYLNDNKYTQDLLNRQNEIDSTIQNYTEIILDNYIIKEPSNKKQKFFKKNYQFNFRSTIKLFHLRKAIKSIFVKRKIQSETKYDEGYISIFKNIIMKTNEYSNTLNSKLYFIYLPSYYEIKSGKPNYLKKQILDSIRDLGIPLIDIYEEVFKVHKNPLSLFPFNLPGHYNEKGYKLISNILLDKVKVY